MTVAIAPDSNNKDGSGILGDYFVILLYSSSSFIRVVVGLGPNSGSNIYTSVGSVTGAAVVDRIFLQNMTTPNFVTLILGRSTGMLRFRNYQTVSDSVF